MRSFRGAALAPMIALSIGMGVLLTSVSAEAKSVYRWETDEGVVSFADELKRVPKRYRDHVKQINTNSLSSANRFSKIAEPAKAGHAEQVAARLARLRAYNAETGSVAPSGAPAGSQGLSIATTGAGRFVPRVVADPDPENKLLGPAFQKDGVFEGKFIEQDFLVTEQARLLIERGQLNPSGLRLGPNDSDPVFKRRSGRKIPNVVPNLNFSPDPNSDEPVVVEKKRVRTAGSVTTQTITVIRQGDKILGVIKPRPNAHRAQSWEEDRF